MDKKQQVLDIWNEQGLMPLFFNKDAGKSRQILRALYDAGARIVEYTNRGEEAVDNFIRLKSFAAAELPGLVLGIGTVKNAAAANTYIAAAADFLVSPGLPEDVFTAAQKANMLWVPGCMTPTEIIKAESMGITALKLFPGDILGPGYVKAIRSLFPDMKFMPTGGVDASEQNIREWFDAGVFAVGMGSKLIGDIQGEEDLRKITEKTSSVLTIIQQLKSATKK